MDNQLRQPPWYEVHDLFLRVGHEVKWPTAKWLVSDVFGVIDRIATDSIDDLLKKGLLVQSSGGWLDAIPKEHYEGC